MPIVLTAADAADLCDMGRAPCASQSPARLYVLQGGSTAGPSHYRTHALQQTKRTGYKWIISSARVSSGSLRNTRLPNRWGKPVARRQESGGDEQGRSLAENPPIVHRCVGRAEHRSVHQMPRASRAQSRGYERFQKRLLPPPSD